MICLCLLSGVIGIQREEAMASQPAILSSFPAKLSTFISPPSLPPTIFSGSSSLPTPCLKVSDYRVSVSHTSDFKCCASPADETVLLSLSPGYVEPDGLEQVKHVESNKEIQALGQVAVDAYNEAEGKSIRFIRVFQAKQQEVVAGFNYYLRIEAEKKGGVKKKFGAVVSPTELLSFDPLFLD